MKKKKKVSFDERKEKLKSFYKRKIGILTWQKV